MIKFGQQKSVTALKSTPALCRNTRLLYIPDYSPEISLAPSKSMEVTKILLSLIFKDV